MEEYFDDLKAVPLFANQIKKTTKVNNGNKWFKNRTEKQEAVLALLKTGPKTTNEMIGTAGHRFACEVEVLRGRGFQINTQRQPTGGGALYRLLYPLPVSENVKVTEDLKLAYYRTTHWSELALERKRFDGFRCTLCKQTGRLETHHWSYDLFDEQMTDLQTFCDSCHNMIHSVAKIAFPSFVSSEVAAMINKGA